MKCHPANTVVSYAKQSIENAEIQKLKEAFKRSWRDKESMQNLEI